MIRRSLPQTKAATYAMEFPSSDPAFHEMPVPRGTCFFIDPTGYFLTARHVIDGVKVEEGRLVQTPSPGNWGTQGVGGGPELVAEWPEYDLALLKFDFQRNSRASHLVGRTDFPYLPVELESQEDGTPVYAFGYPLPEVPTPVQVTAPGTTMIVGHVGLGPRTTSAIIASTIGHTRMVETGADAQVYVLDKALNYGNSGGPIVLTESGRAFAVCSRFQPVQIRQPSGIAVVIPSLYGVGTSISNIAAELAQRLGNT